MDQDQMWPRGRHSTWGSDGASSGGREGSTLSPRRGLHSDNPSHKLKPNKPVWDDTVNDLASMRLTPAELARKLASRQSSNMMVARAQLLEQSRRSGAHGLNLPPTLAARLQAARQQSVDSILAQSNSTLLASHRMRQAETATALEKRESRLQVGKPEQEQSRVGVGPALEDRLREPQTNLPHHQDRNDLATDDGHISSGKHDGEAERRIRQDSGPGPEQGKPGSQAGVLEKKAPQKLAESRATKEASKSVDTSQIAATRTSLDHTITMVVNTCRELWLQLEEERLTREHLQQQLQQQGNVITTLTAELLQIQDQQEAILREVSDARASGLWGVGEGELGADGGEDPLLAPHSTPSRPLGGKPSPHRGSSRHPQRSILRATRTIHAPHLRQTPQQHQPLGRTHQVNHPAMPLSHWPPHSPRPHQPSSRSHTHSLQAHRPSPPPEPPLSPRPESASLSSYKSSVSRQIRDALGNDQAVSNSRDRNSSSVSQGYANLPHQSPQGKDPRQGEAQATAGANKENRLLPAGDDLTMDSPHPELRERKSNK